MHGRLAQKKYFVWFESGIQKRSSLSVLKISNTTIIFMKRKYFSLKVCQWHAAKTFFFNIIVSHFTIVLHKPKGRHTKKNIYSMIILIPPGSNHPSYRWPRALVLAGPGLFLLVTVAPKCASLWAAAASSRWSKHMYLLTLSCSEGDGQYPWQETDHRLWLQERLHWVRILIDRKNCL